MALSTVPAGPKLALVVALTTAVWFALNAGFCFSQGL